MDNLKPSSSIFFILFLFVTLLAFSYIVVAESKGVNASDKTVSSNSSHSQQSSSFSSSQNSSEMVWKSVSGNVSGSASIAGSGSIFGIVNKDMLREALNKIDPNSPILIIPKAEVNDPQIKKMCYATGYPDLCESSIAPFVDDRHDPVAMLEFAMKASVHYTHVAMAAAEKSSTSPLFADYNFTIIARSYANALDNFETTAKAIKARDMKSVNSNLLAAEDVYDYYRDYAVGETSPMNKIDDVLIQMAKTFAPNFIARDIGFENTAGSEKEQAVALHVQGDLSVIYNCRIDGFQDTLLTSLNRQFYRDCTISGTVDFIFGYASAIFQNCNLLIRKPLLNQQCIVTADGRRTPKENSGIVIHNSTITAAPDMAPVKHHFKSYLGRPWKENSRTVVINSQIDDVIHPDGWMPWEGNNNHKSCVYREYGNRGLGADTSRRVEWSKKNFTKDDALLYTVGRFIDGSKWIPRWIPYVAGL